MKRYKQIKIDITNQGAPVINSGIIYKKSKDIVLIEIDLKSKYCNEVAYVGDKYPGISISAIKESLYLKEDVDKDEPTIIKFPEFEGYYIYASTSGRYTINLCLLKRNL